ncbi:MAG: PAS domain S-box protein [Bacteroidetes bacterium]|nr:PAS domain S-box protein [Bacteroidota bacterium]
MTNSNSTNLHSYFFELSQDLICVAGFDGYFKYINPFWEKLLGYTEKELFSKPFRDFIHPDDHNKNDEEISNLSKGKLTIGFENRYICKNGSIKNIRWTVTPLPAEKIMCCIGRDNTKRKQAEEQLKSSNEREKKLADIVREAPIAIACGYPGGKLENCNATFLELTGYSISELQEISWNEVLTPSKWLEYESGKLSQLSPIKKSVQYEKEYICKDGSIVPIELTVTAKFDLAGKIIHYIGFVKDITRHKQAEEELKEQAVFVNQNPAPVFSTNYDGIILLVNKAAKEISDSLKIGKSVVEIFNNISKSSLKKFRGKKYFQIEEIIDSETFLFTIKKDTSTKAIYFFGSNISIRKIAGQKLKESEERFKKLSRLTFEGIFIHKNGILKDVNLSGAKMLGYEYEEIIGKQIIKLLVPEEYHKIIADNIKENYTLPYEVEGIKKDGTRFPIEVEGKCILLKSENNNIRVAAVRDITERKIAENSIAETMSHLHATLESTADGILNVDLQGRNVHCNKKFLEIWNIPEKITPEDKTKYLVSLENTEFATKNIVGQLVSPMEFISTVQELYAKPDEESFDILKFKDGRVIESYSKPQYINNKPFGRVWSFRDITESKMAEQIQKVLYNISNAVIMAKNLEELISLIQKELALIIDTTNFYIALYNEETDTFSLPFLVDEKETMTSFAASKSLTNYVRRTKKPLLANKEFVNKMIKSKKMEKVGTIAEVWLGVPLKIEKKIIGVLALQSYDNENAYVKSDVEMLEFVSDQISISLERKKTEGDLLLALEKAKESDRLKSAFLTNMSHEIRTPMNGILGFTSLLKEPGISGEEQQEYISIIEKSGDRMLTTIHNIVDISRIELGQMNIIRNDININEQTNNLYSFFEPEAKQKGLHLSMNNFLSNNDALIQSDSDKVSSILTNLIKNAIKYSHKGSIHFGYKLKAECEPPELEFYVKDEGIGIPKDRQEAIFDRFIQADIEDKEVYEGFGLGLSISKAYVEMLGGKIWVESDEGKGSSFYFTIPYNPKHTRIGENIKDKTQTIKKKDDERLNILIVDDEETVRKYLKILLKHKAEEILFAKNGKETVEICRKNPDINLIIMDIKMPIMNGYEATKLIREFNKEIVIVAQTAHAMKGDKEKAIEAGCDDYISKPIIKEKLLDIISNHF